MTIHHRPILDTKRVCELYSAKDGVPVTYVCTSALGDETQAMDIFYRETPHPEFGNRYFGLYEANNYGSVRGGLMITNADKIEDAEFGMKEHDGEWHYSQHRHDFYTVGDVSLDGGRAYFRCVGNVSSPTKWLKVKDGKFVEEVANETDCN
jgi:hypothetical protein